MELFAEAPEHKTAVVMVPSGTTLTYGVLRAGAYQLANWFHEQGLQAGDHLALCIENQPAFFQVIWGAHIAGLVYTPVSTRLTPREAAYIIEDCGARVFVTSVAMRDLAESLAGAPSLIEHRLVVDGPLVGHVELREALAGVSTAPPSGDVTGREMLYSSGTTGLPKGVLTQGGPDPIATVAGMAKVAYDVGPETVYLSPAPLYHAAPMRFCLAVQQLGGTVVVMEAFDAVDALAAIEGWSVSVSQWVPTMFIKMLKLPEDVRSGYDVSSMRIALHAAAPCPIAVKHAMLDWWGPIIHEYYAGTEGNGSTMCTPEEWLAHPGTVGRPAGCSVHIVGEDGNEVPLGEEGIVYFEGPSFEYHNDPEKTAGALHASGWSTLGDVGRLDSDGYVYLTDRKAHMIITGGVNVYPQEVEDVLVLHPKVADVAVIGVPNEDFGEEVKAVVQPAPGVVADDELAEELLTYCRVNLASPKWPRTVDFRDELPRHPTGKLVKRLIRDEYWAGRTSRLV